MADRGLNIDSGDPPSLWAAVTAPAGPFPILEENIEADVIVVGAGFTGLSTALHLAKAGVDVIVIEAMTPGWGASGRNNGQVIPTLTRPDPDNIIARQGETGQRFVALLRDSADYLFDLVRRHELHAEAEQSGWIQPVHTPGRIKIAERRVAQWSRHGAPVELLSRDRVIEMTGSEIWHGGFWNRTGGHINPLALARSMADRVVALGGRIYARTPAEAITRERDRWVVATPRGRVTGRALMLATNAYTGEIATRLAPRMAREVVPVYSWQMATAPIGDNLRRTIIPGRQAVSDTHGDLYFARFDARHRLVTGGALVVSANGAERLRHRIGERLRRIWPALGEVRFDYVWNGYIGMTTDFMPRFHRIGPDGYAWVGCNGRGVALSISLGREFAEAIRTGNAMDRALPLTDIRPLPAYGFLRRIAPLNLIRYRWNDAREI